MDRVARKRPQTRDVFGRKRTPGIPQARHQNLHPGKEEEDLKAAEEQARLDIEREEAEAKAAEEERIERGESWVATSGVFSWLDYYFWIK